MPTPFTRQQPSLGKYQALSEQEQEQDNVDFTSSTARERERANQKSTQVCIVFLYYFLAAFGGFLFAIALVNFYPGAVGTGDGVGGNARLKALLSGTFCFPLQRDLDLDCKGIVPVWLRKFEGERTRKEILTSVM